MTDTNLPQNDDADSVEDDWESEDCSVSEIEEIERAYQQALEASEAVGLEMPEYVPDDSDEESIDDTETAIAEEQDVENSEEDEEIDPRQNVTPREVIEALLFVGGDGLTIKKMSSILRGEAKPEKIETWLDELNEMYHEQGRPYEIQLAEGGYRLRLRSDFERIRSRVYGLSPKEIRLSQDAMEILAFVAYRQPVTREQVEETGRSNGGNLLRQLIRRQLIALQRDEESGKNVHYVTTERFLQLFGIASLKELPRREQIEMK